MPDRLRVAVLANTLGLGGTEKAAASCAVALARAGMDVRFVSVMSDGPRRAALEGAGVPVAVADNEPAALTELVRGVDVVHAFRHGSSEPIVPEAARAAGVPRLVELNIFGAVDESPQRAAFDCHLFMSRMCLLRYRDRIGAAGDPSFFDRHLVFSAPIELDELRALAPSRARAKEDLGLDPGRPVVGRVGRADDHKWRRLLVDMVPHLLALEPATQVMFVGATPAKERRLAALGVRDRCSLQPPTADASRLAAYYAACDVFVTAAEIGESQGLAIGEAQAMGLPVVTCSTPWVDNAQVEFVEHGRSGWYAGHPRVFAEAVADLLRDERRRCDFGEAGRAAVERDLRPDRAAAALRSLYESLLATGRTPAGWTPSAVEIRAYEALYPARAGAEFRPLSARERLDTRLLRASERIPALVGGLRSRLPERPRPAGRWPQPATRTPG